MTKGQRRLLMPQTAKWVDEVTKLFGQPVAIKAEENGHKIEWKRDDERGKKISRQGG